INHLPSNFRSDESLSDYLKAYKIPGISGIDTRELIKLLREKGTLKGAIAPIDLAAEIIVSRLKNKHSQNDEVQQIVIKKHYIVAGNGKRMIVINLGMEQRVLKDLNTIYC